MEESSSIDEYEEICPICSIVMIEDYNNMKDCEMCNKTVCIGCVRLTACQTTWGICKNCFDYKCRVCKIMNLDNNISLYLDDGNPLPICTVCLIKNKSE